MDEQPMVYELIEKEDDNVTGPHVVYLDDSNPPGKVNSIDNSKCMIPLEDKDITPADEDKDITPIGDSKSLPTEINKMEHGQCDGIPQNLKMKASDTSKEKLAQFLLSNEISCKEQQKIYHNTPCSNTNIVNNASVSMTSHKKKSTHASSSLSFGERLYRKSLALIDRKQKKVKDFKKKIEESEKKGCSFKPCINDESKLMSLRKKYSQNSQKNEMSAEENVESKFLSSSQGSENTFNITSKKEIESYLKKKEEEDLKELKYYPKKPMDELTRLSDRLFNEAKIIQRTREMEEEEFIKKVCPFMPKVSDDTNPKVENFYKRLQSWIEKRNEKFAKETEAVKYDQKTGQPLFAPKISRVDPNRKKSKNIFFDLYQEHEALKSLHKENKDKAFQGIISMTNSKKISDNSEKLHNTLKSECFEKLFQLMNITQSNVISYSDELNQVLIQHLSEDVLNCLHPILSELKDNNESLNHEEFLMAIDRLYYHLNVDQRRKMLNWCVGNQRKESPRKRRLDEKKVGEDKNFSFHPKVSEKSANLFEKSNRISKNLLERNKEFLAKKETYVKEKAAEKKLNEIKGILYYNII